MLIALYGYGGCFNIVMQIFYELNSVNIIKSRVVCLWTNCEYEHVVYHYPEMIFPYLTVCECEQGCVSFPGSDIPLPHCV